ncbi:MAG TPA: LytR C-terminal domain-containing protein [Actinomycetales bacterium]|nr:LytR C-terminal domain-containing protein [Actinomycetales bacterium]
MSKDDDQPGLGDVPPHFGLEDEWTEEDERRYQERRALERRAARRRRRQAASFALVVLVVLGVGVAAFGVYRGWWEAPLASKEPRTTTAAKPCPTPTVTAAPVKDVTVRVLNATDRQGLAGSVARELRKRGFDVADVGNDAPGAKVPEAAQVRHGPDGLLAARTVAAQIPGSKLVDDGREGFVVDLSLGAAYAKMTPAKEAAKLTAPVPAPSPSGCVPVTPSATPSATPTGTPAPTKTG